MKVNTKHSEYLAHESRWKRLRDVLSGTDAVKDGGSLYLPKPEGRSEEDYAKYVQRATFLPAASKTREAMVGVIFRKAPTYNIPAAITYLLEDADGMGTPLIDLAKLAGHEVAGQGRVGLLVDYPEMEGVASVRDERASGAAAKISLYHAESIYNWAYTKVGAEYRLSMLVLREEIQEDTNDPFVKKAVEQFRHIELVNGAVVVKLWRKSEQADTNDWVVHKTLSPRLPGGAPLEEIPFVFIGAVDLTASVDKSPLQDIVDVNIAHYRNSADYEDGLFMLGQPTPYITGLEDDWIEKHKGQLMLGSRAAWLLPKESTAGLLEMTNNMGALKEAMEAKERQMASLGAQLFQQREGEGVESGTAIRLRQTGEASVLSSLGGNLSRGLMQALGWCAVWMGSKDSQKVEFRTNGEFFSVRLDAASLDALIRTWQAGGITKLTLIENLIAGEIVADGTDVEDYAAELEEEAPTLPGPDDDDLEDEDEEEEQVEEDVA